MASSFVFDNAHGRAAEWYYQAKTVGSPRGIIVVPVDRSADTDAMMRARVTLADLIGGLTNEPTNTIGGDGLRRKTITSGGSGEYLLPAMTYDTTNHWMPCDTPDLTWHSPSTGGVWTDLIFGYVPNTSTSTDSDILCMTSNRFAFTPDGTSNAFAAVSDFFRALRNG